MAGFIGETNWRRIFEEHFEAEKININISQKAYKCKTSITDKNQTTIINKFVLYIKHYFTIKILLGRKKKHKPF